MECGSYIDENTGNIVLRTGVYPAKGSEEWVISNESISIRFVGKETKNKVIPISAVFKAEIGNILKQLRVRVDDGSKLGAYLIITLNKKDMNVAQKALDLIDSIVQKNTEKKLELEKESHTEQVSHIDDDIGNTEEGERTEQVSHIGDDIGDIEEVEHTEQGSHIDKDTGNIVLRTGTYPVKGSEEWVISNESISIRFVGDETKNKIIPISAVFKAEIGNILKQLRVRVDDGSKSGAHLIITFNKKDMNIAQKAYDLINPIAQKNSEKKQAELSSYIDKDTGDIVLRDAHFNPDSKFFDHQEWIISGDTITMVTYKRRSQNKKSIPISQISGMKLVGATGRGITGDNAYVQLFIAGGTTSVVLAGSGGRPGQANHTLPIRASDFAIAEKAKEYIAIYPTRAQVGTNVNLVQEVSVADEILKLKSLMDIGVLTEEEFEHKKKKLLEM